MNAILVFYCLSGFGDQYSNILTGYKAYHDLKKLGYNVEIYWMIRNLYYSSDYPLDYVFDFSEFYKDGLDIKYIRSESEIPESFTLLDTNQRAIKVFVDKIIDELSGYELPVFDIFGFYRNSFANFIPENLPYFETQFVSEECLKISNDFVKSNDNLKSIHFRTSDYLNDSKFDKVMEDNFFRERVEDACNFIENNKDSKIMICSSNRYLRDYFVSNFKNTFYNNFDNELEMHHSYNKNYDESVNIKHAQQIVAEMVLFSKCDKIFAVGKMMSNFLTYGVMHNVHHKNWETKMKNLIFG
jgi:hypothetical protein